MSGRLEALDRAGVLETLRARGLLPVEVKDAAETQTAARKESRARKRRRKIKSRDLVMFTHQMNSVLRANIPLTQALAIIGNQAESETLGAVVKEVRESIEEGSSLADAMREHPSVFPPIYVNTVHMGEVGGVLDKVMAQLADFMESSHALNAEVKSAMYYPAGIILMAVLSVSFILLTVIPKLTPIFLESGVELPAPTRFLIGMGDVLGEYGVYIALGLAAAFFGFRKWVRTPEGNYQWYRFLRAVPGLGIFIQKVVVARIAQTMASLLQSGVPALEAMRLAANTVNDGVVRRSLKEACEKVQKGQGISKPLAQTGVFPTLFVQMVNVGEESGELEEMFTQVSHAYNLEVRYAIKSFLGLMEPMVIGIMAVVVAFIVLALALPMMKISEVAG